jgi:hypothetical protein
MKHSSSREYFAYWDEQRAGAAAPTRSDLAPEAVRHLLGDIFMLSYDRTAGFPFRVAGTRVCSLLGFDAKGQEFTGLFTAASRREIEDIIGIVAEETLATVAGVTAESTDGAAVCLELLLLPFSARSHTPVSLTGLLVPLGDNDDMARRPVANFTLTSWRHTGQAQRWAGPRALRKWSVIRGLTVYEGLR